MAICQKNAKLRLSLWFAFTSASLITLWIRNFELLAALGILCVILAAAILVYEGLRPWPVLGVLFGLIFGQLWFIEFAAMILFFEF
jgi:hypothetical protein